MAGWDRSRPATRRREQGHRLVSWLTSEVRSYSPFWSEQLELFDVRRLEDLTTLPVFDERELAGAGGPGNPGLLLLPTEDDFKRHGTAADLLAAARELRGGGPDARRAALFRRFKPVHVHEAGVAVVLAIAYTRSDLDRLHLAGARLTEVLGLGADDMLVNAVPAGPSVRFWGLYHAALAARMTALHPRGAGQPPLDPVARALAMLPATVLAVPVEEAPDLLDGLAERRISAERLRTVLAVGPPPSTATRVAITESAARLGARQVRVQAVWAPHCARSLWAECRPPSADPSEATYGLHTYPDLEVVEVRDVASGDPAAENQPGELLYTSLGWRGTALVRAATGAWTGGLVGTVTCPVCARTVPRLAPAAVEAAWQPRVRDDDGRLVLVDLRRAPAVMTSEALARAGVRDWSLRAVDGRLVLALDTTHADPDLAADLARAVGWAVGAVPEVVLGPRAASVRPRLGATAPAS